MSKLLVKNVIEALKNLPENATVRAYEGEMCGLVVEIPAEEEICGMIVEKTIMYLHNDGEIEKLNY